MAASSCLRLRASHANNPARLILIDPLSRNGCRRGITISWVFIENCKQKAIGVRMPPCMLTLPNPHRKCEPSRLSVHHSHLFSLRHGKPHGCFSVAQRISPQKSKKWLSGYDNSIQSWILPMSWSSSLLLWCAHVPGNDLMRGSRQWHPVLWLTCSLLPKVCLRIKRRSLPD